MKKEYTAIMPRCPVVLGTWGLSGWMWGGFDKQEAIRLIRESLDEGADGIDTAPIYGFGRVEEWIGEAVRGHRESVYLADKCGMVWHTDRGRFVFRSDEQMIAPEGHYQVRLLLHPRSMRYELEQSLRRLKTDYIDLYQIHRPDGMTAWDDVAETMLRFRQEGKIREIGLCNVSTEKILRWQKTAPLGVNQERLGMIDQKARKNNAAFCFRRKIGFWAYSSLAYGLLASKLPKEKEYPVSDLRSGMPRFAPQIRQKAGELLDELRPFREAYGLSCAGFALAWVLNVRGVTHVLAGGRSTGQIKENLKAAGVRFSAEEMEAVDGILQRYESAFPMLKH